MINNETPTSTQRNQQPNLRPCRRDRDQPHGLGGREYSKHGKRLRYESKRNFNTALHGLRCLKSELKPSPQQEQIDYGNDADILNALLLTILDRTGDDDMQSFRLYNYIKAMPSRLHLELDIDEKSVFGHVLEGIE